MERERERERGKNSAERNVLPRELSIVFKDKEYAEKNFKLKKKQFIRPSGFKLKLKCKLLTSKLYKEFSVIHA